MSIEPTEDGRLVPFRGQATDDTADRPDEENGSGLRTKALGIVVGVALSAVIVAPVTLSAQHLIGWAESPGMLTSKGLPNYFAWIVFLALDLAAVACIGMVTLCAMRGESAGGFKIGTWAFAFASAYANYSGGTGAGKWFFPAMSLAGPTLLEMVLAKVKSWAQIHDGVKMGARPKFGVRWLPGIAFRETTRAWAVSRRENIPRALDAIAFVREVDVLAGMEDADAVRYAAAALASVDPHALRQWLTSRGKVVAQTTLPPVAMLMDLALEDIVREGAPMAEIFAPMPEKLRAPREALGLPEAPKPLRAPSTPTEYDYVREMADKEREGKAHRPRLAKRTSSTPDVTVRRPRKQDHPMWTDAEALYRESIEKGAKLSQRKLHEALNIHRTLAKAVIDHVDDELFPEEG